MMYVNIEEQRGETQKATCQKPLLFSVILPGPTSSAYQWSAMHLCKPFLFRSACLVH
jgi:hypothetical protein